MSREGRKYDLTNTLKMEAIANIHAQIFVTDQIKNIHNSHQHFAWCA